MKKPNYLKLRLRALHAANAAAFIACQQLGLGSQWLSEKARALSDKRRGEADLFGTLYDRREAA